MRLFLASEDLSEHPDELLRLANGGRKMLVITNARDYYPLEKRIAKIGEKLDNFRDAGFGVEELDLRDYFGREEELKAIVDERRPDIIFSIGGNVFLLRTAMQLSGMDKIIWDGVETDRFVYGGYSAGSMVTTKNLRYYGHAHLVPERVPEIYQVDAVLDGLGLIDEYIVPHADVEKWVETTKMYADKIESDGNQAILLNQSSVFVVNGDNKQLLA